jgi:hypothetical protein
MPITTSGEVYAFGAGPGMQPQDLLTVPRDFQEEIAGGGVPARVGEVETPKINPLYMLGAIVLLLVILKIASEHEKAGMETHLMGIGVWNFIVVGILALLFLVSSRAILNKYPVSGLTQIVNAA